MADYGGLDPSVMQYVQGGGMPPMQAAPEDPSMYGLPPQVVSGVQSGFAPVDQVTASTLGPRGGSIDPGPQPMPQLPPVATSTLGPRGRNNFGVDPSVAGAPGSPEVADTQVPSVTGGALPLQDAAAQPIATQPLQPDQTIGTAAPLTDKQVTATNKLYAAQQAHAEAFANSPEGLAAKADAMNQAAIDKERQADTDAAAAQQAQDAANATAIKASNERQAKQDQLDAAKRASDMATTQKYADQYAQQVKDAADYKVNTDRSVNTAGAIAIALSGIGQAISHQHGPNAAFQIISDNQDKQIADQWAKKKSLGDTAAGTKDLLETSRQTSTDDRNNMDLDRAAAAKRDADQIREIAAQFKNPADKAHADAVAAMSDKKSADLVTVAANRKLEAQKVAADQANKRTELGIAGGHLALAQQEHKDTLVAQDRDFVLRVAELNSKGETAAAEKLKSQQAEIQERGAMVPTTLNPDGTAHYEPAMQEDKTTAWLAPKGKVGEDVATVRTATIDGVKAIDALRQKRSEFSTNEQFDNWLVTNEEGRALRQAEARALLDIHKASGINRLSGEAVELAQKELSGGLSADSVKNLSKELDNARGMMVDSLDSSMRGANYTGKKVEFADPLKAKLAPSPSDQQLEYVLTNQSSGSTVGSHIKKYLDSQTTDKDPVTSKKQTIDNWGLTLNDPKATADDKAKAASNIDQTIKAAQDKSLRDYALATQTQAAVNNRAGGAMTAEQPGVSSGSTVKDVSYGGAAQTQPAQQMLEQAPLDALTQQANAAPAGSAERTDARREIIRRADAGDKKAKVALVQVIGGAR